MSVKTVNSLAHLAACAWLWTLAGGMFCVAADEPLHLRIDRAIEAAFDGQAPSPLADDAAFLRRISLDLAGIIPTADDVRQFAADLSPDKRAKRIDQLLTAPAYARHMRDRFHIALMERRGDDEAWQQFLQTAFERNMPWNEMARAMLHPPDQDEQLRGAAFFYTKRLEAYGQNPVDHPGLTRDVGRLFLGVDLQCAQCHDHLFIDDYKQREFQGLYVIFQNMSIRKNVKFPAIDLKPLKGPLEFVSVFDPARQATGPRIPFDRDLALASSADGNELVGVTESLARDLTRDDNPYFARNIVNRLWAMMLGRGLYYPLDLYHADNQPTHPGLLDDLAREFIAHGYDLKWLLREIALSATYQRSSEYASESLPPPDRYLVALEKRLSAEQLLASSLRALGAEARLVDPEGQPTAEYTELQTRFLAAFANEPREPEDDHQPSVKGALFLSNDPKLLELLAPSAGNLTARLLSLEQNHQVADELYLNILSRFPSDEERTDIAALLSTAGPAREATLRHIAWALLCSLEFSANH